MTDTPERDPLEELLAPPDAANTAALRQATLARTARPLRRRRWLRRGALAAVLAACFAAGMLTTRLLSPAAPVVIVQAPPEHKPQAPPAPPLVSVAPAPQREPSDERPADLLLRAGDRYLNEDNDPEAALRCYSRALNAASAEDLKFSPDDNWLLMAIKSAREKEARHADNDS
jgi:hypothetical protein